MYLKNYRQYPYPATPSSQSQEMELVYRRCLQGNPEVCSQPPRSQNLPWVADQRQQEKHIPHGKPSSNESGKEQASEVHEKSARSATNNHQHERKDNCSGNDRVKAAKSKVHPRENKEHPVHDGKKFSPLKKAVKSCSDSSHKNQESTTVKPLAAWNSEQATSQLLDPNVLPKDSSTLPSSSLSKKEEKSETRVKKILPQSMEKKAQGTSFTAQVPVRLTPRIDGVGRTSGSFIALRNDPLTNAPIVKSKSIDPRSSEPAVKKQKTQQKAISAIPGTTIQQSAGKDLQNLDHIGKKAPCPPTCSDDEISEDDIFREIPERYSDKMSKMKEKASVRFKGEQLPLNDVPSKDNKKHSHKNSGHTKEASPHHSRDLKSHSTPPAGYKAGKDILVKGHSSSNAISEKDGPKNPIHTDPRSALILAKRDKLMKMVSSPLSSVGAEFIQTYRLDCETFAIVAKQLVSQDPTIEKQVQLALRKSLQLIGERCLGELKKSIAKYDEANAVKKSK
ncbi:uncharacterized protein LOC121282233 isoform X2 [Carcharodon carcharias]|uniref:uncharacterized protein LOC121282233 isoform X2 n=1 Tax=Carcharodon carcharias TaxID=13397 RepID=UPI001B7EF6C6|nr:uncharacterized protein LOC121282233 isoform X2 [Carcharodon carcharias]